MNVTTFEEFTGFLRSYLHIKNSKPISYETEFERDLGVSGDDGDELLLAIEKRFNVILGTEEEGLKKTFGLGANEYLFHSEASMFSLLPERLISIFSKRYEEARVRAFTVGELFDVVCRIQQEICAKE